MSGLLLNIGCGEMPLDGYQNIDSHPYAGVDVVWRVPPLPYEDSTVQHIYSGHFIEHLAPWQVVPFVTECYRVLMPGGTLTLVAPDADKARLLLRSKRLQVEGYVLCVQGAEYDDMPHWSLWNPARLQEALAQAGLTIDDGYDWHEDERVYDHRVIFQCGARGVKR